LNPIAQFLQSVSDEDLRQSIAELQALDDVGVLPDGVVRRLSRQLRDEFGVPSHDAAKIVQTQLVWQAALRWVSSSRPDHGAP
jgi:hypothetical protein